MRTQNVLFWVYIHTNTEVMTFNTAQFTIIIAQLCSNNNKV